MRGEYETRFKQPIGRMASETAELSSVRLGLQEVELILGS